MNFKSFKDDKKIFGTVLYSQILQIRLMLFIHQWFDVRIRVLCIANVLLVISLIVFAMPFSCGGSNHLCKKNLRGLKAICLIDHKGLIRGIGRGTITYCLCYSSKNSYCTRNLKNTISIMSIIIYNVQLRFFTLPYCTGDLHWMKSCLIHLSQSIGFQIGASKLVQTLLPQAHGGGTT